MCELIDQDVEQSPSPTNFDDSRAIMKSTNSAIFGNIEGKYFRDAFVDQSIRAWSLDVHVAIHCSRDGSRLSSLTWMSNISPTREA